jgi:hypothetical protein
MQGYWAILPSFLAPESTYLLFSSRYCLLFFLFQQALIIIMRLTFARECKASHGYLKEEESGCRPQPLSLHNNDYYY